MDTAEEARTLTNSGYCREIEVGGRNYERYAVKTHFIEMGEDYIEIIRKYVTPLYFQGDILSISEKIISLCQGDVVLKSDLRVGRLAKVLSRYAYRNPAGPAMDSVYKMQMAINVAGPIRVFTGAALSALTKPFGKKGVFYNYVGHGVRNIDGFYSAAFDYYADKGILAPSNPDRACQRIKDVLGIDCMIVDANDIDIQILGTNREIRYDIDTLAGMIKDNPAGQKSEQTPFILIREAQRH
jgi:hypothetical protein